MRRLGASRGCDVRGGSREEGWERGTEGRVIYGRKEIRRRDVDGGREEKRKDESRERKTGQREGREGSSAEKRGEKTEMKGREIEGNRAEEVV